MPLFVLVDVVLEKKITYIFCMSMGGNVEISGLEVLLCCLKINHHLSLSFQLYTQP